MSEMKDASDAIKGIVEAVPIYDDLLQPAVVELGKGLHTLSKTIHIALAPVSALVWGYDKIRDFIQTSVEKKLENFPAEEIIPPAPEVAVPIIEALRYTGHREELREMFSNLLAKSMRETTANTAHPAFVEIIKQLSPDEAKIIRLFMDDKVKPLITVRAVAQETGYYAENFKDFSTLPYTAGCQSPELGPGYLTNLLRLGLIWISYDSYAIAENSYDDLVNHAEVARYRDFIESVGKYPDIKRGIADKTAFGTHFVNACLS